VRKGVAALLILGLSLVITLPLASQEKGKKEVATDPEKAGPDYAIQGEYVGRLGKGDLGAEVVARGDGEFLVNLLPGGLRGEGGDYSKRIEGKAQRKKEEDVATVTSKDGKWTATIASGHMRGKTADGEAFNLKRVVRESKTLGKRAPAGAIVLFDGKNADEWVGGKMVDHHLLGSDVASKRSFKDHKIHLEFRLSFMPYARGQGRSNSGVYVQHRWEIQVLDSFGLKGENNECGGIYSQYKPLVNMCYPPLTWQTYDINFKAARFDKEGKKVANAVISVRHNGVLIHDNVELKKGETGGGRKEDGTPGPLFLQGHGGQVQYRNIWVVEMPAKAAQ
jgi:hypothetical protein